VGILILGVWMIVFGINLAGWVAINGVILGIFGLVVGIVLIVENKGMIKP
jgi:hypothetical protein